MDDSKDPPCQLDPSPIYYYESYPNLSTGTGTGTTADENKDQLYQSDPSPICYYESYPNVATSGTIRSSTKKSSVQYGNNKSWEGIKPPPSSGQSKPVLSQSSSVTSEPDQPRSSSARAKPPAAESQSPSSYSTTSLELNFLGLPLRPGKKDCPYYMRNGSCKYGDNCKFNHPDPTVEGDSDSEWDGYQVPPERNVRSAPTYVMNSPVLETNVYTNHQPQMVVEEYPEHRGQPESSYLKTKDRKHKSKSKHHHPKNRFSKSPPCALNDKGLPLRPNSNICLHYGHNGTCKFGHACKFDHPTNPAST